MEISRVVMWFMALGALLGGVDLLLGSRFGLGQRFEEAFRLLGPIGLSMAGILCLSPVLASFLDWCAAPLLSGIGLDPGILEECWPSTWADIPWQRSWQPTH